MESGTEEPVQEMAAKGSRGKITSSSLAGAKGSSGTRESQAWLQTASKLGIYKEERRRERERPINKGGGLAIGRVTSSKAATHPPVHPGHPGGSRAWQGAQRNAAREGRLTEGD